VECAAGLMDLLMLASGVQSNGLPMVWTAEDLLGAFTLASFLEKVVADWNSKEEGAMLIAALDAALTELMASCPALPPVCSFSISTCYLFTSSLSNL
jgi:hemerythrin superfamily protein